MVFGIVAGNIFRRCFEFYVFRMRFEDFGVACKSHLRRRITLIKEIYRNDRTSLNDWCGSEKIYM